MQGREWFDADAVVISDFIAQRLPDEVVSKVGNYSGCTSTVFTRWRCQHMANPASCAFSIISGALIPGCEAACSDAGGVNYYSREATLSRTGPAIRHTEPDQCAVIAATAWSDATAQSATNCLRHFTTQQRTVPLQTQAIFITGQRKLVFQGVSIHTDPHRRQLKRIFQYRVPDQNIPVQTGVTQLGR